MESIQIDWLAVVIAAALNMVIGFVWYSKALFSKEWMKLADVKESEMKKRKGAIFWEAVASLVIAYFLAFFEGYLNVTTVSDGAFVGFCAWLGFVATTQSAKITWEGKSLKLFFIESGYRLLAFLVMGGVIGA